LSENGALVSDIGEKIENKWLILNPETSGAASSWILKNKKINWTLKSYYHPSSEKRGKKSKFKFHSKYILVAKMNANSLNGFLYIGSGNLSKQGFALTPGGINGNIETGVVLELNNSLSEVEFCGQIGIVDKFDLTQIKAKTEGEDKLNKDRVVKYAPPVLSFKYKSDQKVIVWEWAENIADFSNIMLRDQVIQQEMNELFINGEPPGYNIKLSAKINNQDFSWLIPVFNEAGRYNYVPDRLIDTYDAIDQINSFPSIQTDDDEDEDETDGPGNGPTDPPENFDDGTEARNDYKNNALYSITSIIESIASQNQIVTAGQFDDWIEHLKRILIEEFNPDIKSQFSIFDSGIFNPLKLEEGFTPSFITSDVEKQRKYLKLIDKIIYDWNLIKSKEAKNELE
jgi:hypothetical protein